MTSTVLNRITAPAFGGSVAGSSVRPLPEFQKVDFCANEFHAAGDSDAASSVSGDCIVHVSVTP